MALKKSEKRLLILLGIVAIVFIVDRFLLSPGSDEPAESESTVTRIQAASTLLSGGSAESTATSRPRTQFSTWGRDPFSATRRIGIASSEAGGASVKHRLKGLFWKEGKAFALIDDLVIGEGEEDNGLRVDKIEGNEVRCRQGSRTFTLHWRESP